MTLIDKGSQVSRRHLDPGFGTKRWNSRTSLS
jgi:hypothetical protein